MRTSYNNYISLLKFIKTNKLDYITNYYSPLSKTHIITIYYNTSPQWEYLTYNKNFFTLNQTTDSITYKIILP